MALTKTERRSRIKSRIRKVVSGTSANPRLSVYRSNKSIYAQVIDDVNGVTMLTASSKEKDFDATGTKSEIAYRVGQLLAKKAQDKGIEAVSFDRGGYLYHGRVKSLAEGARKGGLKF